MVPGLVKWRWGKHSPQTDSSVLSFGVSPVCLYPVGFARLIILNLDHSGSSSAKAPAPDNALLLCARLAVCSEADIFLQGSDDREIFIEFIELKVQSSFVPGGRAGEVLPRLVDKVRQRLA